MINLFKKQIVPTGREKEIFNSNEKHRPLLTELVMFDGKSSHDTNCPY